jgi:hypothetical protein
MTNLLLYKYLFLYCEINIIIPNKLFYKYYNIKNDIHIKLITSNNRIERFQNTFNNFNPNILLNKNCFKFNGNIYKILKNNIKYRNISGWDIILDFYRGDLKINIKYCYEIHFIFN